MFKKFDLNLIKTATLLFGICRTQELASGKIIAMPQQTSPVEQMKMELAQLTQIRSKFYGDPSRLSDNEKKFLTTVDVKIAEISQKILALELSPETKSA